MRFQKILCSVDFSPGSSEALRLATEMCTSDTALVVVHVWQPFVYTYGAESTLTTDITSQIQADAERELGATKREAERLGAARVTTSSLEVVPADPPSSETSYVVIGAMPVAIAILAVGIVGLIRRSR